MDRCKIAQIGQQEYTLMTSKHQRFLARVGAFPFVDETVGVDLGLAELLVAIV